MGTTLSGPRKHGHCVTRSLSPTYSSWSGMRDRCHNPNNRRFKRYGGRGIKVCERWNNFENFLADMGERPPGKTLDRFPDNDGNYEPGNCRWATPKEQQSNTAVVGRVRCYSGPRGEKTLPEWSAIGGTKLNTLYYRLRRGWSAKEAVFGRLQ